MSFKNCLKIAPLGFFSNRLLISSQKFLTHITSKRPAIRIIRTCHSNLVENIQSNSTNVDGNNLPVTARCTTNHYYLQYLLNNAEYDKSIFHRQSLGKPQSKALEMLREVTNQITLDNEFFEKLEVLMAKELSDMNFNEFLDVLYLYCNCTVHNKYNTKIGKKLLTDLDNECLKRISTTSVDQKIQILHILCHSWNMLDFHFVWKMLHKFCYHVKHLSSKQMVHLFYLISKYKRLSLKQNNYNVQDVINNRIQDLNMVELGIISLGFFNSRITFSHQDILSNILQQCLSECEKEKNFNSFVLISVCKNAELSLNKRNLPTVKKFQNALLPHVSNITLPALVVAVGMGLKLNHIDENLTRECIQKVKESIKDRDLKDIERITFYTSLCSIRDSEFLELALEEFEKRDTVQKHSTCLIQFLRHLLHHRIYPQRLLEKVLTNSFYQMLKKENKTTGISNLAFVLETVNIDLPHFTGSTVDDKIRHKMIKVMRHTCDKHFHSFIRSNIKISNEIESILEEMYGQKCVMWNRPLPHYPNVFLMRFNKDLNSVEIPPEYINLPKTEKPKQALNDGHYWLCLFPVNLHECIQGKNCLNLIGETKVRHLKNFGYHSILINPNEWKENKSNNTETEFLQCIIKSKLQEISY